MSDRMPDPTPPEWRGPSAAALYVEHGLRVVPLNPASKEGARKGFGKAFPEYCCDPSDFKPDELIAILLGPCPLGNYAGGRLLCGFDLDAPFDHNALENALGCAMPRTLSSKNGRHLYYWITPEQQQRGEIRQANDLFRTKKQGLGALDLRPSAGGYFLERGDWDGGFDISRIVDLPDAAHACMIETQGRGRGRPPKPCEVTLTDFDSEVTPMNALGLPVLDGLARELGAIWPRPGQGGGHDLGLALGGVMADAHGSIDDVLEFAARVNHYAGAPDTTPEVLASVTRRRSGALGGIYGWPTLRRMLLESNPGDDNAVDATLNRIRAIIPGLQRVTPGFRERTLERAELFEQWKAAGCPGIRDYHDAFKRWAKAQKTTPPSHHADSGARTVNQPEES